MALKDHRSQGTNPRVLVVEARVRQREEPSLQARERDRVATNLTRGATGRAARMTVKNTDFNSLRQAVVTTSHYE